jgi:hypothetical protein
MALQRKYAQLQPFTLAGSGSNLGDTTLTLSSFNDIDGNALSMTAFGTKGYGTLEPGSSTQEEQISFTGISTNSDGSVTLTGVSNVLFLSPYTETSGLAKIHAGGVRFVISNTSGFYSTFANTQDSETIDEVWMFAATPSITNLPVANNDAANKVYVDNTTTAGAPNANETTRGIVQLATSTQTQAGTSIGSTTARLVPPNSLLTTTSAGAGNAGFIPVLGAAGTIDGTMLANSTTTTRGVVELATNAELAAGTASGSAGPLAATGSSFNATPSAAVASDSNKVPVLNTNGVIEQRFIDGIGTSGAAISIGQGLYIKASDGKLYTTAGTADESTFSFVGIAQTAAAGADVTIRFARPGQIANGLSGLTAGSYYYVTDTAGTLGTTPGTRYAKVGQAMSTTTMRVIEPKFIASGVATSPGSNTSFVVTTGFYPAHIEIKAVITGVGAGTDNTLSVGDDTNHCKEIGPNEGAVSATHAWQCRTTGGIANIGNVSAKSATTWTGTNSGANATADLQWTAWSE